MQIYPVILCGGSGTRLWPVSRAALPKPFLQLMPGGTLFEQALDRFAGDASSTNSLAAKEAYPLLF